MSEDLKNQGMDLIAHPLIIELPCQIFERVKRYAKKNGLDVDMVMLEAIDGFLSSQC
jgi:hypothetical protein